MASPRLPAVILTLLALLAAGTGAVDILSKSHVEVCVKDSDAGDHLSCDHKIVVEVAVPSDSSGGEASVVANIAETAVENNNGTKETKYIRDPPVVTVSKSAVYAAYDNLVHLRDVAYRPVEQFVETRKCEPDAGADVLQSCERLRNENGSIIEHTEPVCCPCGPHRVSTSCGDFIDTMVHGKRNTVHCVRFPGEWFHVFKIGKWSLGFSIRVQVKKGSSISEVVVSPDNRAVLSGDKFLGANLIGDFAAYTSIVPSFEDFYLVTPRKGASPDHPADIGTEYSRWMLLDRFRFTYNGLECNKIGVSYEAFQNQPNFCSVPFRSCLSNQLWNFLEDDQNRVNIRVNSPNSLWRGDFKGSINIQNAGVHSFSVGVTEVLQTNLLMELKADDIRYVYQRSRGKILRVNVPKFEALSQVGTAYVTTKNIGKLEASYSLTFNCSSGINLLEEQFFTMKPEEASIRLFNLHTSTDQAAEYQCTAILKASDSSKLDRKEYRFSTAATVLNNGTQIGPPDKQKKGGTMGFLETVKAFWHSLWDSVIVFFTGPNVRAFSTSDANFSTYGSAGLQWHHRPKI